VKVSSPDVSAERSVLEQPYRPGGDFSNNCSTGVLQGVIGGARAQAREMLSYPRSVMGLDTPGSSPAKSLRRC